MQPDRLALGTMVRLRQRPAYLKTADPMPMLRPPDLIGVEEQGQVVEHRALGQLAVRFRRGTFLLAADQGTPVSD
ncbi:MAG: NAD(P)H dehydrogenase assembly family protein [Cyanobium sp.]